MSALVWSQALEHVFRQEILEPIKRRSIWPEFWLGIPFREIQPLVLEMGRADFRRGFTHPVYGTLTAEDKVLLYCLLNLRSHFYALLATFQELRAELTPLFAGTEPFLMVDLGAGPGTGSLALGEHLAGRATFDYWPTDLAPAMLERAARLFAATKAAYGGRSSLGAYRAGNVTTATRVMLNASYLFASDSLDVDWVVDIAHRAISAHEHVVFVYTNSIDPRASRKWEQFCESLGVENTATEQSIEYLNNRSDVRPRSLTFMRAVLQLR